MVRLPPHRFAGLSIMALNVSFTCAAIIMLADSQRRRSRRRRRSSGTRRHRLPLGLVLTATHVQHVRGRSIPGAGTVRCAGRHGRVGGHGRRLALVRGFVNGGACYVSRCNPLEAALSVSNVRNKPSVPGWRLGASRRSSRQSGSCRISSLRLPRWCSYGRLPGLPTLRSTVGCC